MSSSGFGFEVGSSRSKGDVSNAVDKALAQKGGDALLNVSLEASLYGFVPICCFVNLH
jgi:hypothetical protein